jgi:hypothetical protein
MENAMKAATSKMVVCVCLLSVSLWSGAAFAQSITVDAVDGLYGADTLRTGTPIMFKLRYVNPENYNFLISNGYEIYSPDGAEWSHSDVRGDTLTGAIPRSNWDLSFAMNVLLGTGTPPRDTVGIIGARLNAPGLPPYFNGVPYGIAIGSLPDADNGMHICIDSAWFRPGGTWKWAASGGINRYPSWAGPYCYLVYVPPDLLPTITNAPASLSGRHCVTMSYDFNGADPEGEAITFELVSGPGSINASTGLWSWQPSMANVGQSISIEVRACEVHGCGTSVTIPVTVTNEAPTFTSGCRDTLWVTLGSSGTKTMRASDGCSDPLHYVLSTVSPPLNGSVTINSSTGVITFVTNQSTTLGIYSVLVYASDSRDSVSCTTYFRVSATCCIGARGNANGDSKDLTDIADVAFLVGYLFRFGPPPPCVDEGNVDASPDGVVDISDLTFLINYIFYGGTPPPPCP